MEIESIKSELKQLIAKGQNEKALERLLELTKVQPAAISDQIISLSSAYKKLKEDISYGTLSDDSEKQFSNELTRRLIGIVNSLVRIRTPEEMEAERIELERQKAEKEKSKEEREQEARKKIKKSYSGVFLGILLLVTAVLVFDAMSSEDKAKSGQSDMKNWEGLWEQEIEAGKDKDGKERTNTGTLRFTKVGNALEGTSDVVMSNGGTSQMELYNIVFNAQTGNINGHWKILGAEDNPGSFEFALKKKNTFTGFYTFGNSQKKHSWKGKKK